ncbi:MAG: helix-turn-helix domain-containing protein [Carboxydocellales bacterium]
MVSNSDDEVMTLEQVAKYLKIHYQTALKLVGKGEIPAGKIGRDYKIFKSDVISYLERLKKIELEKLKKGR